MKKRVKKYTYFFASILFIIVIVSCLHNPATPEYKFANGRYLFVVSGKNKDGPPWKNGWEYSVSFKDKKIKFIDPRYGEAFLHGTLSNNEFEVQFKKMFQDALFDENYSTPSIIGKAIQAITFNVVRFTPYIKWDVCGKLIDNNKISGTFQSNDLQGNTFNANFTLTPSTIIPKKERYPNLAIGNGIGPMIKKYDPRTIEIFLNKAGIITIDDTIYKNNKSFGKRILKSASTYGSDIPVALNIDKDVSFAEIKKQIQFISSKQLCRFQFKYFRDKKWDGLTMFQFETDPFDKKSVLPENSLIRIKCFPDYKYKVISTGAFNLKGSKCKLGKSEIEKVVQNIAEAPSIHEAIIDLQIHKNVKMEELIQLLELLHSKKITTRFLEKEQSLF